MPQENKANYVYYFADGKSDDDSSMKDLLSKKGAGLSQMTGLGLPVPPGFVISTETCYKYFENNGIFPDGLREEFEINLKRLESETGKTLGNPANPLLLSIRTGASINMPGLMETILNIGLNDDIVEALAKKTGNRLFALNCYRRFIISYSTIVKEIDELENFDKAVNRIKNEKTIPRLKLPAGTRVSDIDLNEDELTELVSDIKSIYKNVTKEDFPQDPIAQLWESIETALKSWMSPKCSTYRRIEDIKGIKGTAVIIQLMVLGNMDKNSGTGVCLTRNPVNGENNFYGDYLSIAQGEDVIAGIRKPIKITEFATQYPESYNQLVNAKNILERNFEDMQDIEFTVEQGKLFILQTSHAKRSPLAAYNVAVDMVEENIITKEDAITSLIKVDIDGYYKLIIDPSQEEEKKQNFLTKGIEVISGVVVGRVALNSEKAVELAAKGDKVILVLEYAEYPDDLKGMKVSEGILTLTGGKTSHAAVMARGLNKSCVTGCENIKIDKNKNEFRVGEIIVKEGDYITIDGTSGEVYKSALKLIKPKYPDSYYTVKKWEEEAK